MDRLTGVALRRLWTHESGHRTILAFAVVVFGVTLAWTVAVRTVLLWGLGLSERARLLEAETGWMGSREPEAFQPVDPVRQGFWGEFEHIRSYLLLPNEILDSTRLIGEGALAASHSELAREGVPVASGAQAVVYPGRALWTHPRRDASLSPQAALVFRRFAQYLSQLYAQTRPSAARTSTPGGDSPGGRLATMLRVGEDGQYLVRRISIATPDSLIATFPASSGTTVRGRELPAQPWFLAAFRGATALQHDVPGRDNAFVTVPYLDLELDRPALVRSYFAPVDVQGAVYVLAVDIERVSALPSPLSAWLSPQRAQTALRAAVDFGQRPGATWIGASTALAWALLLRGVRTQRQRRLRMRLESENLREGTLTRTRVTEFDQRERRALHVGGAAKHLVEVGGSADVEESQHYLQKTSDEVTLEGERGVQLWLVDYVERSEWRYVGLPFASERREPVGRYAVEYINLLNPRVEAVEHCQSLRAREVRRQPGLLAAIAKEASREEICVDVPFPPRAYSVEGIPERLTRLDEYDEHLIFRDQLSQGRFYFSDGAQAYGSLYTGVPVQGVIRGQYLALVLKWGQGDFLFHGTQVDRLIAVNGQEEWDALVAEHGAALAELVRRFERDAKRLRVADTHALPPALREHALYDFALAADSYVIVTRKVRSQQRFDTASGTFAEMRLATRGYVAWRQSDVLFFRRTFKQLEATTSESDARLARLKQLHPPPVPAPPGPVAARA